MISETTPHTFQLEHYSTKKSKLTEFFFPALMICVGIAGMVMLFSN